MDSSTTSLWTSLFPIAGWLVTYYYYYVLYNISEINANNVDPDQMPHFVDSDLGLHCLPITLLVVSRQVWAYGVNLDEMPYKTVSEQHLHWLSLIQHIVRHINKDYPLSRWAGIYPAFANSVDLDQLASALDLHCLPFSMWIYISNLDQVIWLADN